MAYQYILLFNLVCTYTSLQGCVYNVSVLPLPSYYLSNLTNLGILID